MSSTHSFGQLTPAHLGALALCVLAPWQPAVARPAAHPTGHPTGLITGTSPVVATGDIDGDHRADRIYLESGGRASTLRFVLASGRPHDAIAVPPDSLTVAALDLDNDHDLDILIVSRSGRLTVLVNRGNGEFWPKDVPVPPRVAPLSTDSVEMIAATTGTVTVPRLADIVRSAPFRAGLAVRHLPIDVAPGRSPPHSSRHLRGPPGPRL